MERTPSSNGPGPGGAEDVNGTRTRITEALLSITTELAELATVERDLRTGAMRSSSRFWEMHGVDYAADEWQADFDYLALVHPDDRAGLAFLRDSALTRKDAVIDLEWRVMRPDGEVRRVHGRATLVYEDEEPIMIVATLQDVTDRQDIERGAELHMAVAGAIGDWMPGPEAGEDLMARLAGALDSPAAVLWVKQTDGREALESRWVWSAFEGREGEEFVRTVATARFHVGEGLPGRVWQGMRAQRMTDALANDAHVRDPSATFVALGGALAFPVVDRDELLAVVEVYPRREIQLNQRTRQVLTAVGADLGRFLGRHRDELGQNPLSRREREVLQIAADGGSVAQIAESLSLRQSTVKTHLEHIHAKLGVGSRSAAVAEGLRVGIIE